jgi:ribose 5-phosphate isomerase RpiB
MRIAVVNEVSARDKNKDIVSALQACGQEVFNVGMTSASVEGEVELTYIHTGLIAATLLNLGAADMVVGGCGTGQGFLNSVMQYPNVFCGLILNSLDAFLFSQINAGNCVSLALNKGYGWAGDLNLKYIFEKLFAGPPGAGYPPHRSESQAQSRERLCRISQATHTSFGGIVRALDREIVETVLSHRPFRDVLAQYDDKYFENFAEAGQ